jgi:pyridoxine 5-phosphate synthase
MPELGLNIDHVATLREARYRGWKKGLAPEPDVVAAGLEAEQAGADQITVHLREDARHIQPADVRGLLKVLTVPLNLEMATTPEMARQALAFKPREVCLVPERREELTTEGGLNLTADVTRLKGLVAKFHRAGIRVSAFIDPEPRQVEAAQRIGAQVVELHTGAYANALTPRQKRAELSRHARAAQQYGLQVNAGHGLHYTNVREYLEDVPHLHMLNIGHAIIARSIFVGLTQAIREMRTLLRTPELMLRAD